MQRAEQVAALKRAGAPPAVVALARLFEVMDKPTRMERATQGLMRVFDKASLQSLEPWPLLPELQALKELDKGLPSQLRLADPLPLRGFVGTGAQAPLTPPEPVSDDVVVRVLEAITPWISVPVSFEEAMVQADDPAKWAETAPQIEILGKPQSLRADGALARWRLTKQTSLLKPLLADFNTQETIDISVEGRDDPDKKSGVRRYSHVLVSSAKGPGLVKLRDDTGSIELTGDQNGCLVCIRKRIVAEVPRKINDEFGGLLSDGLLALLWYWATAFGMAAAVRGSDGYEPAASREPLQIEDKQIVPRDGVVKVAVLGGGPAGLACAWLLSKPAYKNGDAWSPPKDKPVAIDVQLVEKEFRLGGKAASGRRYDDQSYRIEEHGLHVLMGFYKNVLEILSTLNALGSLEDIHTTLLPPADGGSLDDSWRLNLAPWEKPAGPAPRPLLDWVKKLDAVGTQDWKGFGLKGVAESIAGDAAAAVAANDPTSSAFLLLGHARPSPRPLLRTFVRVWQLVAKQAPAASKRANAQWLDNMTTQVLLRRVSLAEMGHAAKAESDKMPPGVRSLVAQPPEEALGPLAGILREHARSALQGKEPQVALAREAIELSTTISIGLANADLLPTWSLADPGSLVEDGPRYADWVRQVQQLDRFGLSEWLLANGVEKDFPKSSRILAALTAGLFTTPDEIAAGTFVNGLARFLLTYDDAPYKRMRGGTGEAVIGPIFESLKASGHVCVSTGAEVTGIAFADGRACRAMLSTKGKEDQALFKSWLDGRRAGWPAPAVGSKFDPAEPGHVDADAFVLAIPPFQKTLPGLPEQLADKLGKIVSRATVGVQCWTTGQGLFPKAIFSGLDAPMRCVAVMDHLQDEEGPDVQFAPVYYCGDVEDNIAEAWFADKTPIEQWLQDNFARFQKGRMARTSLQVVNHERSNRYVCADVDTQAARLYPFETGIPNLWLAGDWTRTALSCGSLEAAVTSGLEAARDILLTLGCEVHFDIVGACFERTPKK